jgi:hypothetical protein
MAAAGKRRERACAASLKAGVPLPARLDVDRHVGEIARKRHEAIARGRFAHPTECELNSPGPVA